MCSVRQSPIPSAPNSRALAASGGLSAFVRTFSRRIPSAHSSTAEKSSLICGGTSGTAPTITSPVPPSIVIVSPSFSSWPGSRAVFARSSTCSASQPVTQGVPIPRATTAACDVEAAVGGEDALRLHHPVEVVGRRLPADEDDALARLAACLGGVGVEDDRARRGARRGVQTLGDDLHLGGRVDHRVQQLVELRRIDAGDRFLLRDQPLLDHLHRRPERRRRGSLRGPRLQEEERSLLDRELDVLHVAVVLLEPADRGEQLRVRLRQQLVHALDRLGRADARDDVLALRVLQELAVEPALAGRRVTREADARPGAVALVAEDHLDDVDGGAEVVRDLVRAPVDLRAGRVPGVEDGAHRLLELGACVLRERTPGLVGVGRLERLDQLGQVRRRELDILLHAARRLHARERLLEAVPLDAVDHLAVHLDQAGGTSRTRSARCRSSSRARRPRRR